MHKACRVAKGFTQENGVRFCEVFAPITTFATYILLIRLVETKVIEHFRGLNIADEGGKERLK